MTKIKELAEQAGIEFTYDPTEVPMRAFIEAWEGDLEKFAELIVRHCIYKFGQTRTEPSLEKYIMDGLKNESRC